MKYTVKALTHGPAHHFFGFHDLVEWNAKGDLLLGLEVHDISHPPLPGQTALSGVIEPGTGTFAPVHRTQTFNYPQGARQQWLGESDHFLTNDRDVAGNCVCRISDARERHVIGTLPFPVHCHEAKSGAAFFMNYDRVYRTGGYGYIGGRDVHAGEDIPAGCGVFKGDVRTGEYALLTSMTEIALCGESQMVRTGYPHYVTHLVLNPAGTRLAFLHRYRVPDGGEITRLMTVGADGGALRCLAKGFLSHFDWLDDQSLMIWGQDSRTLCRFRERRWLGWPGVAAGVGLAKRALRAVRTWRGGRADGRGTKANSSHAFLRITDTYPPVVVPMALGILTEDGHPMVNPRDRRFLVNDTYPGEDKTRTLMLYRIDTGDRWDIGHYRMLDARPDLVTFDTEAVVREIDRRVLRKFQRDQMFFTRSGFHCDLHPRWNADGRWVAFDSIHDGTRQIYVANCSEIINVC